LSFKLKVTKLSTRSVSGRRAKPAGLLNGIASDAVGGCDNHFFTESLILAQDERWRRA
jgi:hypothetical protein